METVSVEFYVKHNLPAHYLGKGLFQKLEQSLKDRYEGTCFQGTYIERNSLKLIKKTLGSHRGSHFIGEITYYVIFRCDVYKPIIGSSIQVQIISINDSGILSQSYPTGIPLQVFMIKDHHAEDDTYSTLKSDDIINIELLDYNVQFNQIYGVGKLIEVVQQPEVDHKFVTNIDAVYTLQEPVINPIDSTSEPGAFFSNDMLSLREQYMEKIYEIRSNMSKDEYDSYAALLNPYELITPSEAYLESYPNLLEIGSIMKMDPPAITNDYYVYWEILKEFNLINVVDKLTNILTINGASLLQAVMNRRTNMPSNIMSVMSESSRQQFRESYQNIQDVEIFSYPEKLEPTFLIDNTSKAVGEHFKKDKLDLVFMSAEPDLTYNKETQQNTDYWGIEFRYHPLLLSEIILAMSFQSRGGTMVVKVSDFFTHFSAELLALLNNYYNIVHVYKPKTSNNINPERFVIAQGLKEQFDTNHLIDSGKTAIESYNEWIQNIGFDSQNSSWDSSDQLLRSVYDLTMDIDESFSTTLNGTFDTLVQSQLEQMDKVWDIHKGSVIPDIATYQTDQRRRAAEWCQRYVGLDGCDTNLIRITDVIGKEKINIDLPEQEVEYLEEEENSVENTIDNVVENTEGVEEQTTMDPQNISGSESSDDDDFETR